MRPFRQEQSAEHQAIPASGNAATALRARSSSSRSDLRRRLNLNISIEGALYIVIAVLALISRFWDLTSRAMNHDESLHAYYSWLYVDHFEYIHDPLMHGPFLFHFNAFIYFLFGDNDYTSRIGPAIFGTMIVLAPALLRSPKLLGRWGALIASLALLVSPSILYYSRFIRHDVYTLFATFIIAVAALRFMERPQRRWLVLAGAMTGLLFCTKEVSFIVAFIMVTFLVMIAVWQVHRMAFAVMVGTVMILGVVVGGLLVILDMTLPSIPWEHPTNENIQQFVMDLAIHPVVLGSLGVLGLGLVAMLAVMDRLRTEGGRWLDDVLGHTPRHTTAHTLYLALKDKRGMWLAIFAGLAIFTVLYTSMFSNIAGLSSSTFGALGYWLGQQDVQRGEQPWFYYLLLLPQYELVAVIAYPITAILTLRSVLPSIRSGEPVGMKNYVRGFLLYWSFVMLIVLSWAGEKMPWLVVHVTLPMILLAASFAGQAVEYLEHQILERAGDRRAMAAVGSGIVLVCAAWFYLWAWGTAGPWVFDESMSNYVRTLQPTIQDNTWILFLPLIALLALVVYGFIRLPWRVTVGVASVALLASMLLAQVHLLYRMTYEEGDVALDMLMYSQASPDTAMTMEDLGELSRITTGGMDLNVWYDSCTAWPFQWYLRTYPERHFFGSSLSSPPDADVLLIGSSCMGDAEQMLTGYTYQEYTMRWFFPENPTYRRFAIAPEIKNESRQNYQTDEEPPYSALDVAESVWSSIWSMYKPEQQAQMFRLLAYREVWDQIRSDFDFRVYVRNDLLDIYNTVRYETE